MSRRAGLIDVVRRWVAGFACGVALAAGAATAADGRGRLGLLEAEGERTLGWLVKAGAGEGLAWQPANGGEPLALGVAARIRYRGLDALGGIGAGLARDGDCWRFVDIDAAGPAGRDGRIVMNDRLVSVAQGRGGRPIAVVDIGADEVRGLLRGIVGSTVVVTIASAAGAEQRIELVRDETGRGDLAGAAPRDVLDRALAIQDATAAAGDIGAGPATVHLRWGDAFPATVVTADGNSVAVRVAGNNEVTIATEYVRAIDFQTASGRPIQKQKMDRLLTIPRMQKTDPPTHLLRLTAGDYVRGRLLALDQEMVRLQIQATEKQLPRDQVARIIWLGVAGEPKPEARDAVAGLAGTPLQLVGTDGRRLTLAAVGVDEERVVGRSPALGEMQASLTRCAEILLGEGIREFGPAELPYEKWVLKPAPRPRALDDEGSFGRP
jgi:exosome complex RNA-binding protein Csl4